jgi:hypothetical protein
VGGLACLRLPHAARFPSHACFPGAQFR